MSSALKIASAMALTSLAPAAANATVVGFAGTVVNTCVLTVTTPGALTASATGTVLDSDESGGVNAIMTVVSTGNTPTITFAAPTLTGPTGSTANATKEIAFTSTGGAAQGFISTSTSYLLSRFSDTMTVKGRVTNSAGFATGAYTLSTTVTCQQ